MGADNRMKRLSSGCSGTKNPTPGKVGFFAPELHKFLLEIYVIGAPYFTAKL